MPNITEEVWAPGVVMLHNNNEKVTNYPSLDNNFWTPLQIDSIERHGIPPDLGKVKHKSCMRTTASAEGCTKNSPFLRLAVASKNTAQARMTHGGSKEYQEATSIT